MDDKNVIDTDSKDSSSFNKLEENFKNRYDQSRLVTAKILGWDDWYNKQKNLEYNNDWDYKKRKLIAKLIVLFFSIIVLTGLIIGFIVLVI